MIQFISPVSGSKITDIPGSKSIKLSPSYGSPIVSPYQGRVDNVGNDSITILHNLNDRDVYSHFSGIHRPQVGVNVPLKQGETIAYGDTTDIEYSILDDNGKKQPVIPFFKGINTDVTTNTNTASNDDDDDKKNKEENNRPKPIAGKSYIADFLSDIALSPFKAIHKPMQKGLNKLSGDKDDDGKLNEEIDRIKKLLK